MSTPPNPLAKRKLPKPKGRATMTITPGWTDDEPPVNSFEAPIEDAPGQTYAGPRTDAQRKNRKLQRS